MKAMAKARNGRSYLILEMAIGAVMGLIFGTAPWVIIYSLMGLTGPFAPLWIILALVTFFMTRRLGSKAIRKLQERRKLESLTSSPAGERLMPLWDRDLDAWPNAEPRLHA
ncbi:hypothetical protein P12x_000685 [Tundrisphaera lichenicola]|uniref:hypothetical protein n=1 Tax=Tundrisphaera lichenicola TaxID=2029860 RepID=UPI003EBA1B98